MLSALDFLDISLGVLIVGAYAYIAYSALAIRRTLAVGVYRKHSLGVALIALFFAANYITNLLPLYSGPFGLVGLVVFYGMAVVLLYWVDSAILAARQSDPLTRDSFGWSKVRILAWSTTAAAIVLSTSLVIYFFFIIPSASALLDTTNLIFQVLIDLPIYTAAISGAVVMPIAARRSKDSTLKIHLQWFFLFIALQLVLQGGVGQFIDQTYSSVVDGVALVIGSYILYKSARRLVPLYRFSTEIPRTLGKGVPSITPSA